MSDFIVAESPGTAPFGLLMLHGTGGDEHDLADLGHAIAPDAAQLRPRGKVLEGSANRYFRRIREGVFDPVDFRFRSEELAEFVATRTERPWFAIGFSNGASISIGLLTSPNRPIQGAILLRGQFIVEAPEGVRLDGVPVLLLSGEFDPIVPLAEATKLVDHLRSLGAEVEHRVLSTGHNLVREDVTAAQEWLARKVLKS